MTESAYEELAREKYGLFRGAVLPDEFGDDDWVIISVLMRQVEAVDIVLKTVCRWSKHDDGIRVEVVKTDVSDDGFVNWVADAITVYVPPKAVADYLRR